MDMGLLLPPHVLTVVPPPKGELPSVFPHCVTRIGCLI